MTIQAEISLYPLKTLDLTPVIVSFLHEIESHGLQIEYGRLSSLVSGDSSVVFPALQAAYEHCCDSSKAVLCLKITNTAPPSSIGVRR